MMKAFLHFSAAVITSAASSAPAQVHEGVRYASVPEGAYSVVAEITAKPGREAELRTATLPLVQLVRSDPKNLVYFLQEDRQKPGRFVFYEVFANQADFEAHNAQPYVKAWFAKLPELAEGGVTVTRMTVLQGAR
ncbi:putative quinol monooxygenase [Sphingomonas sp. BK345]|uniref:putative quinol monooxygenase n=1 Tax=Sphingomonas sp. BK345 TaxID=2586980 RepID=UPI00161327A0|nr:putative quinol monooxygenase [Sphingomonas sp. BK345]MBB3475741.1 quinol monooxygenase YgiN [Sphingomonas sp. BK345]